MSAIKSGNELTFCHTDQYYPCFCAYIKLEIKLNRFLKKRLARNKKF